MKELKYILVDSLPEREQRYLEENLSAEKIRTVYLNERSSRLESRLETFPAEECIFISENRVHIDMAINRGMATLGYVRPVSYAQKNDGNHSGMSRYQETEMQNADEIPGGNMSTISAGSHLSPDMYAEGMEEIGLDFLRRVYQRHHRLPWTILETERCIVKEFSMDYLDDLFDLYAGEGMTDYMEPLYPYEQEREYQQAYIENMYRFYGYGMWIVCEKATGKLIGRAGIDYRSEAGDEPHLGYAIAVPYQRQGYATEVCRAIIDYARAELEFPVLCCLIEENNRKSIGLAGKLGFVPEGTIEINGKNMRKFRQEITG